MNEEKREVAFMVPGLVYALRAARKRANLETISSRHGEVVEGCTKYSNYFTNSDSLRRRKVGSLPKLFLNHPR
jgi:hypothetical protein